MQTPTEHLFCEDELLTWMTTSDLCPVTKMKLDPLTITRAGRVIQNMLGELKRYCMNKEHGCQWTGKVCHGRHETELRLTSTTGPQSRMEHHLQNECSCIHSKVPTLITEEEIASELEAVDEVRLQEELVQELRYAHRTIARLKLQLEDTRVELMIAHRKLAVYDQFFSSSDSSSLPLVQRSAMNSASADHLSFPMVDSEDQSFNHVRQLQSLSRKHRKDLPVP